MATGSKTPPLGCFSSGYEHSPLLSSGPNEPSDAVDALACQDRCKSTQGCKYFAFSPKQLACYMSGEDAHPAEAKDLETVSGPVECPEKAGACTEVPDFHFPGLTKEESHEAWAPVKQPMNLQCWPRARNGSELAECPSNRAKVVEDTNEGWDGRCDGLRRTTLPAERCQVECMQDPLCAVWQLIEGSTDDKKLECFHGALGTNCYNRTSGRRPARAQRILHGGFRVLRRLRQVQIIGLVEVFAPTVFINSENAAAHCRLICISALLCQYWQYSDNHGCWVEDALNGRRVPYPLVNDGHMMKTDSKEAAETSAGEFIQHICEDGSEVPLPTDSPLATTQRPTTTGAPLGGGGAASAAATVTSERATNSSNDMHSNNSEVRGENGSRSKEVALGQNDDELEGQEAPDVEVHAGALPSTPTAHKEVAVSDGDEQCHRKRCLRQHGEHRWEADWQCCAPPGQGTCRAGFHMLESSQSCSGGGEAASGSEMVETCCVLDSGHGGLPWPVLVLIITGVVFMLICCGAWALAVQRRKRLSRSSRGASLAMDGYRSDSSMDSRQAAPLSPYGSREIHGVGGPALPPPCGHGFAPYGLPPSVRSSSFSPPGVPLQ